MWPRFEVLEVKVSHLGVRAGFGLQIGIADLGFSVWLPAPLSFIVVLVLLWQ